MCNHDFVKINDVTVCRKCGLTRTYDGKIFFDKKLPNRKQKKRKKENKNVKN